jgi:glutathione S-transferase
MGSQECGKISPFGKVPCLVCDDGMAIAESAFINESLEQQFFEPLLLSAAATDHARVRVGVRVTEAYVFARYLPLFAIAKVQGEQVAAVTKGMEAVMDSLAVLDRFIDGEDYAIGNALSLADGAIAPALFDITEYAAEYFGASDALENCSKLEACWSRIQTNPHVARALAER